jgi:DNA-3-methyladenine glycosylase II
VTPEEYERARRLLVRRDPVLGAAIKQIGACGLASRQRHDHLTALVGAIVSQQLSTKAAATILARVLALFPEGEVISTPGIARLDDTALRGAGLSGQKIRYLRDLCAHLDDGRLSLEALEALPDEAVIESLTRVKGFGRWTAQMFLMFRLHRPDVLPVDDLGIVNAVHRSHQSARS